MQVKDVMTRNVECASPDDSIQTAARKMRDLAVGPLPVCEDDRLIGMVTDRDITLRGTAEGRDPKSSTVRQVMTPELVFCYEDQDVRDAADAMAVKQIRRLAVLNRDDRLVGIVSLGDLAVDAHDDKKAGQVLQAVSEPAEPKR